MPRSYEDGIARAPAASPGLPCFYQASDLGGERVFDLKSPVTDTIIKGPASHFGVNSVVSILAGSGAGSVVLRDNIVDDGTRKDLDVCASMENSRSQTPGVAHDSVIDEPGGVRPGAASFVMSFSTISHRHPIGIRGIELRSRDGSPLHVSHIENDTIVAVRPTIDRSYSIAVIQCSGDVIDGSLVTDIDPTAGHNLVRPSNGNRRIWAGNGRFATAARRCSPSLIARSKRLSTRNGGPVRRPV